MVGLWIIGVLILLAACECLDKLKEILNVVRDIQRKVS